MDNKSLLRSLALQTNILLSWPSSSSPQNGQSLVETETAADARTPPKRSSLIRNKTGYETKVMSAEWYFFPCEPKRLLQLAWQKWARVDTGTVWGSFTSGEALFGGDSFTMTGSTDYFTSCCGKDCTWVGCAQRFVGWISLQIFIGNQLYCALHECDRCNEQSNKNVPPHQEPVASWLRIPMTEDNNRGHNQPAQQIKEANIRRKSAAEKS